MLQKNSFSVKIALATCSGEKNASQHEPRAFFLPLTAEREIFSVLKLFAFDLHLSSFEQFVSLLRGHLKATACGHGKNAEAFSVPLPLTIACFRRFLQVTAVSSHDLSTG